MTSTVALPKTLTSIQTLRAVAAVAVVLRHMSQRTEKYGFGFPGLTGDVDIGRWGVDLFFVISGFIMVAITKYEYPTRTSTFHFWRNRLWRIVPLYWFVTSVMLTFALIAPRSTDYVPHFQHAIASYFFIPWTDPARNDAPIVGVGWSLNYEMYFYLVFGLMLTLPHRMLAYALVVWAASSTALGVFQPTTPILKMMTSPLLMEFVAGTTIGALWKAKLFIPKKWTPVCLAVSVCALLVPPASFYHSVAGVLLTACGASLFIYACVSLEMHRVLRIPDSSLLVTLGNWSYSLYLSHVLTIGAVGKLIVSSGLTRWVPGPLLYLFDFGTTILVAAALHYGVERKAMDLSRRFVGAQKAPPPVEVGQRA